MYKKSKDHHQKVLFKNGIYSHLNVYTIHSKSKQTCGRNLKPSMLVYNVINKLKKRKTLIATSDGLS